MNILFYLMQADCRGCGNSVYNYAHYNETILGNKSFIATTNKRTLEAWPKFTSRFDKCFLIDEDWSPTNNTPLRLRFEQIVRENNIDVFYVEHEGKRYESMLPTNARTCVHAVFDASQRHGTRYAANSEYMARKSGIREFVPHVVILPDPTKSLRPELNIPNNATVFGRHGGKDSFHNLVNAHNVVKTIATNDPNTYFLFLNTDKFVNHERIIFLDMSIDPQFISNFINSCDAMLHVRNGETFGLAVGEFSYFNKPVITYGGRQDDYAHLDILGDNCIKYFNDGDLYNILGFWRFNPTPNKKWDAYRQFTPESVMAKFKEVFLV